METFAFWLGRTQVRDLGYAWLGRKQARAFGFVFFTYIYISGYVFNIYVCRVSGIFPIPKERFNASGTRHALALAHGGKGLGMQLV